MLVLTATVEQSKTVFAYALAFLQSSPALRQEVVDATRNEIRLKNGVIIAIHTNSFRTIRGRTLAAQFSMKFFFGGTTPPRRPMLRFIPRCCQRLRRRMACWSVSARRIAASGSCIRSTRHFGVDGDDVLVVQGGSKLFNPSLDDGVIAAQRLADPTAASSEWDAEFRADLAAFLDDTLIDGAVEHGRPLELPPRPGVNYRAFVDAAGGRGTDHYVVAIGHEEGEHFVIDVARGVPHRSTQSRSRRNLRRCARSMASAR